ncbi:zf-HC2 domain-containing protein [Streptomyces sp. NPDC006544]|uniref:anti-sigma factor family protein n=1 Tax=Streptomyces sp. NPDC006544 TaxID=3154583 RepID=UPI0033AE76F0
MSPTTGTVRHPDVSEISELAEGLLSPARTAEVRAHLADCALCADVRASLEEIRALLGTLPGPARMPADISGRIDAALAAEALLDATTPVGAGAPAGRSGPSDGRADTDVSRETPPPAPLGGTGAMTRPSGHPAGPTGPGRRRARRRIALAGGLLAACAAGVLLFNLTSGPQDAQDMSARPDVGSAQARSGAHPYTAQGLQGSVRELLASAGPQKKAPEQQNNTFGAESGSPPAPELAPGDREAPDVPTCVQKATGRTESPLAFETGSFQGSDVFLLVLPHPGDPASVDAYVVGSACVATPGAPVEKPLLTSTYPRS